MTEEQNKLADELDAEVKNERSGKIANLMMRASAALRAEPSTEAVLEEALRGWTEWMGTECSRDWRADEARIAEIRALKGKGASQGAIRERLETDAGYAEGLLAAQAPEPSGEFVRVRKDVVEFLRGAAPLDGFWFGEKPLELQAFWWRKYLSDEQKG